MNSRALILIGLLVTSGALVAYDQLKTDSSGAAVVEAVARPNARSVAAPSPRRKAEGEAQAIAALIPRATGSQPENDAFAPPAPKIDPKAAAAALKPPPPPPPPPPPTAPPLPFAYLGKKIEGGEWTVYLARQDRVYVARANQLLDSEYQVVAISPATIELLYLPLKEKQTLPTGAAF